LTDLLCESACTCRESVGCSIQSASSKDGRASRAGIVQLLVSTISALDRPGLSLRRLAFPLAALAPAASVVGSSQSSARIPRLTCLSEARPITRPCPLQRTIGEDRPKNNNNRQINAVDQPPSTGNCALTTCRYNNIRAAPSGTSVVINRR
jgi:hypothetical protein